MDDRSGWSMGMWVEPSDVDDLRRRRCRSMVQELLDRAQFLDGPDQRLIEGIYREGLSVSQIAALTGADVRSVRRRRRRLVRRMSDPLFQFVAGHLEELSPTRRRVARSCVLQGASMRAATKQLRLSLHAVRRHCDAIRAMSEVSYTSNS